MSLVTASMITVVMITAMVAVAMVTLSMIAMTMVAMTMVAVTMVAMTVVTALTPRQGTMLTMVTIHATLKAGVASSRTVPAHDKLLGRLGGQGGCVLISSRTVATQLALGATRTYVVRQTDFAQSLHLHEVRPVWVMS